MFVRLVQSLLDAILCPNLNQTFHLFIWPTWALWRRQTVNQKSYVVAQKKQKNELKDTEKLCRAEGKLRCLTYTLDFGEINCIFEAKLDFQTLKA